MLEQVPIAMLKQVPIDSIIVDEGRQRRVLDKIPEMANSLERFGQIQPIVLSGNMLVAGQLRLEAAKYLGWDSIEAIKRNELGRTRLHALELEENIKRRALPWRDECRAVWMYHQMRLNEGHGHRREDTANELGMSRKVLNDRFMVHEEILAGNELVINADKLTVARNIVARQRERMKSSEIEGMTAIVAPATDLPPDPLVPGDTAKAHPLLCADFEEWIENYAGSRFNFIHCDFPYGVNADKHHQGAARYYRGYADNPEVYWTLVAALGDNIDRLAADSAHLMFWFSMDYYTDTRFALEQMGWRVNPFPLIWHKADNTGILPDPNRGPRRVYETAFIAARGDRKIVQPVSNCFPASVKKTMHMSEKSLPMLKHFFRMFVDNSTVMLDPTCGSASAVRAAYESGAKSVLGLEKDQDFHALAVEKWHEDEKNEISIEI